MPLPTTSRTTGVCKSVHLWQACCRPDLGHEHQLTKFKMTILSMCEPWPRCEYAADYGTATPHVLDYSKLPCPAERVRYAAGSEGCHPVVVQEWPIRVTDAASMMAADSCRDPRPEVWLEN